MAGFMIGAGTGFFSKASAIQDENRKLENDMLKEDFAEFNKSLTVYRAAKAKQTEQDNTARGFAMMISGDPRDQKALDIARQFIVTGHDPKDPISQAQAKSAWLSAVEQDRVAKQGGGVAGVGAPPANVANPNAPIPNAPAQAPGLGGAPAAPQSAPTDTPQGQVTTRQQIGNAVFGKHTPEQLQAKSVQNIAGRTGMTPEQVQAIRTGADTGQTKFDPSTSMAPINPGSALLIQSAMKMAGEGKIKDTPAFFNAINKGDFEGAGKFLASVDDQNAWHLKVAEIEATSREKAANIQADATIKGHQISAQATRDAAGLKLELSPHEKYGKAAAALEEAKQKVLNDPTVLGRYKEKYPSFDPNDPRDLEWAGLQELDTESRARVLAGPNNKPDNSLVGRAMDYRTQPTPPSAVKSAGKPGETPKSVTEPPPPSVNSSKQEEAKKVADMIKLIKDPTKQEEAKKRFLKDYPKYYTENFLDDEQKKKDEKKKLSAKEEENNKAMKSLKNTNVKNFTD